jgi:hypothetical protein
MKLTEYTETRLPTHDVDLEAPPDIRWKHIAQKEAQNIGRAGYSLTTIQPSP